MLSTYLLDGQAGREGGGQQWGLTGGGTVRRLLVPLTKDTALLLGEPSADSDFSGGPSKACLGYPEPPLPGAPPAPAGAPHRSAEAVPESELSPSVCPSGCAASLCTGAARPGGPANGPPTLNPGSGSASVQSQPEPPTHVSWHMEALQPYSAGSGGKT